MESELPSKLTPRQRGIWPRDQHIGQKTVSVTIRIQKDQWEWLATALGSPEELGHSEFWNVEGVLGNAIRYMRDDPSYLASLALELKEMAGDELDERDRALARFLQKDELEHFPGEGGVPF